MLPCALGSLQLQWATVLVTTNNALKDWSKSRIRLFGGVGLSQKFQIFFVCVRFAYEWNCVIMTAHLSSQDPLLTFESNYKFRNFFQFALVFLGWKVLLWILQSRTAVESFQKLFVSHCRCAESRVQHTWSIKNMKKDCLPLSLTTVVECLDQPNETLLVPVSYNSVGALTVVSWSNNNFRR